MFPRQGFLAERVSEMCDMSRMEDLGDLGRYRACFVTLGTDPRHRHSGFKEEEGDKGPVFPESALVLLVSQQIKGVKGPFHPPSWLLGRLLQVLEFFPPL